MTESAAHPGCDLTVTKGACTVLFAYDIGYAIDLDRAEALVAGMSGGGAQRDFLRHTRKSPRSFRYQPAPLRAVRRGRSIAVAGHETEATVTAVVYDFGSVSIAYTIPLSGGVDRLAALGVAIYDHAELLADSRGHAQALISMLGEAVTQPGLAEQAEDYVVYHIEQFAPGLCGTDRGSDPLAREGWRRSLAAVLRAESAPLSRDEVDHAMSSVISYGQDDAAIVDWNAAILFGPDMEDALAVLEFANVELVEMRFLDDRLDRALDRAHRAAAGPPRMLLSRRDAASLREIATLQVNAAVLFEGVNNTLKLMGDQYLARLYHAAMTRFHLPDWDASILRKIGTLESIYDKLNDRQTTRRMEALEWIIIGLIAFEVLAAWVWPMVKGWLASP